MTGNKTEFVSLRRRNLLAVGKLLLAGLCLTSFLLLVGSLMIGQTYNSPHAKKLRADQAAQSFATYVQKGELASTDGDRMLIWAQRHRQLRVVVLYQNQVVFEAQRGKRVAKPAVTAAQFANETLHPVTFSDGTGAIWLEDHSTERMWVIFCGMSVLAGMILMLVMVLRFSSQKIHTLETLTAEVEEVKNGRLYQRIELPGNDELALLSRHIEELRQALIAQAADEKQAWDQNYELLTAVSHDIRTPLTALLGYLTLLQENPADAELFVQPAYQKALQLKELTDDLFRYFLVYGKKDLVLEKESFPVAVLLQEMLGERVVYLRSIGFEVQTIGCEQEGGSVLVDSSYLMRVFDNLFSNIQKYADPEKPVILLANLHDGRLLLIFDNVIAENRTTTESTGIGLKTCEKIVDRLGGRFEYGTTNEHFQVELELPLEAEEPASADAERKD